MNKTIKSMWLRRVMPLSLAGALVLPLQLGAADAPAGNSPDAASLYEYTKQIRTRLLAEAGKLRVSANEKLAKGDYNGAEKDFQVALQTLSNLSDDDACDLADDIKSEYKKAQSKHAKAVKEAAENSYKGNHAAYSAVLNKVEAIRRDAMTKASKGQYAEAISDMEKARESIAGLSGDLAVSKRAEISSNIKRIKRVFSNEIMKEAQKLAGEKKYTEAVNKAVEAKSVTPEREYIDNFVQECQKHIAAAGHNKSVVEPDVQRAIANNKAEVDRTLREAIILARNKRYEKAIGKLESVLLLDAYNSDALNMLSAIYKRLYKVGMTRSEESALITQARNSWEWSDQLARGSKEKGSSSPMLRKDSNAELYKKLQSVVVSDMPKDGDIGSIISYLRDEADKVGVKVRDNVSLADSQKKVVLGWNNIPLMDAMRYFGMAAGLVCNFNGNAVEFGKDISNMSVEEFTVRGNIISEIIGNDAEATKSSMKEISDGDGAPSEDAPIMESDDGAAVTAPAAGKGASVLVGSAKLREYFSERMIPFEGGADITYNKNKKRLLVKNTPENLRRIGAMLEQLRSLETPMVMVEAKLIQLTDNDLNELGFEWTFSASRTAGKIWSLNSSDPTRHGQGVEPNVNYFRVLNDLKILPNFGQKLFGADMDVRLDLSINAVAQNDKSEVLASPKILADNGETATLNMHRATYFVTDWEEPEIELEDVNSGVSLDMGEPDFDDAKNLGVTFTVTPTVMTDNRTIELDLNMLFDTQIGKTSFEGTVKEEHYINGIFNANMSKNYEIPMWLPDFAQRSLISKLVVSDGETVLIGGVVDNRIATRDDKWPLLGDIPLLGRLFRDQQISSKKETLLLFVTARLLKEDGSLWNPDFAPKTRGVVDFIR